MYTWCAQNGNAKLEENQKLCKFSSLSKCKCASGIRGMACPCTFLSLRASCSWSYACRARPRPSSAEALVYRGGLLLRPTSVPSDAKQDGIGDNAPTLCGCWCCCVVVVVVVVCLFPSRSRVSRNTYTPARWSFLVAFSEVFVNVSFPRFVLLFVTAHALCRLTNHVLELHRLNDIRVPLQGFLYHAIRVLVLRDSSQHALAFVKICP